MSNLKVLSEKFQIGRGGGGVVIWGDQICSRNFSIKASKNQVLKGTGVVFLEMRRVVNHDDTTFLQLVK